MYILLLTNKDKKEAFKLVDSLIEELRRENKQSKIIVTGDFNSFLEENDQYIKILTENFLCDVTEYSALSDSKIIISKYIHFYLLSL